MRRIGERERKRGRERNGGQRVKVSDGEMKKGSEGKNNRVSEREREGERRSEVVNEWSFREREKDLSCLSIILALYH